MMKHQNTLRLPTERKLHFNENTKHPTYVFIATYNSHSLSPLCIYVWLAIQWTHETLKTALPHGDQASCSKRQAFGVFQKKKHELEEQEQLMKATTSSNLFALRTSFLLANHMAKAKNPFTIFEKLMLPAAKDFVMNFQEKLKFKR